jgi:hypothetical protein
MRGEGERLGKRGRGERGLIREDVEIFDYGTYRNEIDSLFPLDHTISHQA